MKEYAFQKVYDWRVSEPLITLLLSGSLWEEAIYRSPFIKFVMQECF